MSKPLGKSKFALSSSMLVQFLPAAIAVGVFSLVAACSGPTGERRSAVDAAKLCNGDANAVFAGTCLQRGASVNTGNPEGPESTATPEATQTAQATVTPVATAVATASATAAATATATAKPPVLQESGGEGEKPPAVASAKSKQLKMKRDTFVAIAQSNVIRNCFVPAETVIVVSGEVSSLNNFKKLGVNQNIAFGVTSVTYPKNFTQTCALNGEDFVYLADHGELSESR